jgi:energy-coupling factor transporter ATP-binding protein EcfA2
MKLDKLILVNWGALRAQEYSMGNMTLLTGPTGSGKSTMLDALQTVMTAAYQNIFSYNPGQDETTQGARNGKTKRTLWSYIAGAEDNLFARPDGAHGYIAAVFKPSEGESGKEFTALVAAAARVDGSGERRHATQERLAFLIIDEAALTLEDVTNVGNDGQMAVVPVEKIDSHLKGKYRHVANFRDTKREYLCQLYGRFRGQKVVSFPEAELAARAWSQSIAHKPIGSVDELVKTQILEHDHQQLSQRITQISGLMRQVSGLRADGERLKANISRLERIADAANRSTNAFQTALQYQLVSSKRSVRDDENLERSAHKSIEELSQQIQDEARLVEALNTDKDARTKSQVQIQARLSGIPAADQKRRIEERLSQATSQAQGAVVSLLQAVAAAETIRKTARIVVGREYPGQLRVLEAAVARVAEALAPCSELSYATSVEVLRRMNTEEDLDTREVLVLNKAFEGADGKFAALYGALTNPENSFVAALHTQLATLDRSIEDAAKREKDAAVRKANLAEGGADYPRPILYALNQLKADLRGSRPQVLCDLIEPAGPAWHAAIEGYMGGARFNLVVDQEWEARAITFMRERNLKGNIIQGTLCLKHAKEGLLTDDSIVHELVTEHPIARAYLVDQFGGVVKVPDAETLRHTPRGLTQDGKGSGGRTMFTADAQDLVFGKEAKRLARERAERDHAEAEGQLRTLKEQRRSLHELLAPMAHITLPAFLAASSSLERAARELEVAKADLSRLDLSEVKELEAQDKALALEIRALNEKIRESDQRVGQHQQSIFGHQQQIRTVQVAREAKTARVNADTVRLRNLCLVNSSLSSTQLEEAVDELLAGGSMSQHEVIGQINRGMQDAQRYLGDVREFLAEYNSSARNDERFELQLGVEVRNEDFAPVYGQLVSLAQEVRDQLAVQREIGLVKNLEQLRTAESSFKDVFTKQFCYEIRNAVDIGVKTLRALNVELDRLKFGTDRFRIDWSDWVPEFKDYYDFFSTAYELSESQDTSDLFGATELSVENCKVRDRLVDLLLANDQERALRELQRVADYRNYRRYEIWKESDSGSKVALSSWGTGSGGQLETPAYIVRAAVVTNRLKHFDKGINLKLMVNDESFAKMDERRAHDVIKFMRDHLGMQLICAMPTKHAGALKSEFNKEWCFTRTEADNNGEVDFVSEADERDLNPDKLRALWQVRREQVRQQAQIAFENEERDAA